MRIAICLVLTLFLLSACAGNPFWLPRAHKISVQQGNLLNAQQLSQVTVGMDREKVRELIGTPVVNMTFQQHRWDYLYTLGPAGSAVKARRVSIIFRDNAVAQIDSNTDIESGELPEKKYFWERVEKKSADTPYQELD